MTAERTGQVARLREICLALPEATEKPFGGHTAPTWRVRDKIFGMCGGEYEGEELALWCKAPPGAQDVLVAGDPSRYFVPPYVGHNGWVGVRLDHPGVNWDMIAALVADSYRMTAPKRLIASARQRYTETLGKEV
jgi:predicted DNA-binding protein (MmcQ/YjbR family)